jgi:alpha-tubulin suppressor-like RCC1 family protein
MNHLLLIDSRVNDIHVVTQSLLPNVDSVLVNFQEDTLLTITSKIQQKQYNSVGIFQENYYAPTYQFVAAFENSTLENVEVQDPELNTWKDFIGLLTYFKENLECNNVDLMGCCIFSDNNWKYVLDQLNRKVGITINSSVDNTGAESLGGNWILESNNANLIGTYFTENIKTYTFILGLGDHSLFLTPSGDVYSCGLNGNGQLGLNDRTQRNIPVKISTLSNIKSIAWGLYHSLFLDNSGNVWSCGLNTSGQLGHNDTTQRTVPVKISTLSNIKSIDCGSYHSLFLDNSDNVWSCGSNTKGQLGLNDVNQRNAPVKITTLSNIKSIDCGGYHSLFLDNSDNVWSCGQNINGQLGHNDTTQRTVPVKISTLSNIKSIACGSDHSLFLDNNDNVWSCGYNATYQLGLGDPTDRTVPVKISTLSNIKSIDCGGYHSLFLDNSDNVWSCGYNTFGQLGLNNTTNITVPVKISTLSNIKSIDCGGYHSLFLDNSDNVWSCGYNSNGQLGLNDTNQRNAPVKNFMNIILARSNGILANNSLLNDFTLSQKRSGGYTISEMKDANYSDVDLKLAGYTLAEMKLAGYTAAELKPLGYTLDELFQANYTIAELKIAYTVNELNTYLIRSVNYLASNYNFNTSFPSFSTGTTLFTNQNESVSVINLTTYNYPFKYIHVRSNGWIQLSNSNVSPAESIFGSNNNLPTNVIRIFGANLVTTFKYTITSNYIYLNYTGNISSSSLTLNINVAIDINSVIIAKYILSSNMTNRAAMVGFTGNDSSTTSDDLYLINNTSNQNLYDLLNNKCVQFYRKFTVSELNAGGYTAAEMKDGGYTAAEMSNGGYTGAELKTAGYTAAEMKDANYSVSDLKTLGYTPAEMKPAGYPPIDLINNYIVPSLQQLNLFTVNPSSATDFNTYVDTNQSLVVNLPNTVSSTEIQQAQNVASSINTAQNSSNKLDLLPYLQNIGLFSVAPANEAAFLAAIAVYKNQIQNLSDSLILKK